MAPGQSILKSFLAIFIIVNAANDNCDEVCGENKHCLRHCGRPLDDMTTDTELSEQSCGISGFESVKKSSAHLARIIDGDIAGQHRYPWMASLRLPNRSGIVVHFCGGALINSRYIVTAAHCSPSEWMWNRTRFALGTNILSEDESDYDVYKMEEFITYPGFEVNSSGIYNDIALVRLKEKVRYTTGGDRFLVNSLCLPSRDFNLDEDDGAAWLSGYGFTGESEVIPILREGKYYSIEYEMCRETISKAIEMTDMDEETKEVLSDKILNNYFDETNVCMARKRPPEVPVDPDYTKMPFKGDSGSSLLVYSGKDRRAHTVGVISAIMPGLLPVFMATRVSHYTQWIKSVITNDSDHSQFMHSR